MRIVSETTIRHTDARTRAEITLDSIRELEEQYARGEMEQHAYFLKKRALIKLL